MAYGSLIVCNNVCLFHGNQEWGPDSCWDAVVEGRIDGGKVFGYILIFLV